MNIFYCIVTILFASLIGYLIGAIPNAILVGKIFYHRDPSKEGSKNIGGTNAGRVLGVGAGITVIFLDIIKIVLPFIISYLLFTKIDFFKEILFYSDEINAFGKGNTINQLAYWIVPFCGIIGHCYSPYVKFKGGKAVSSSLGMSIGASYISFIIYPLFFFATVKITKKVSLGSLISTLTFAVFSWIIYIIYICCGPTIANYFMYFGLGPDVCIYFPVFTTLAFLLIVYRHRVNIHNLQAGTESDAYWLK